MCRVDVDQRDSISGFCKQVYHTAWRELCEAMVKAGSLDEVIYVHETYLLSIQRQCFVVQEKLVIRSLNCRTFIYIYIFWKLCSQ